MDTIETIIRDVVRDEIASYSASRASDPDLITVDEAVDHLGGKVGRDAIYDLHRHRETTGFPSVVLGERRVLIDKHRLNAWIANGGLGVKV